MNRNRISIRAAYRNYGRLVSSQSFLLDLLDKPLGRIQCDTTLDTHTLQHFLDHRRVCCYTVILCHCRISSHCCRHSPILHIKSLYIPFLHHLRILCSYIHRRCTRCNIRTTSNSSYSLCPNISYNPSSFCFHRFLNTFRNICLLLFNLRCIHIPCQHIKIIRQSIHIFLGSGIRSKLHTDQRKLSLSPPRHSSCHINLSRNSGIPRKNRKPLSGKNLFHPANLLLQKLRPVFTDLKLPIIRIRNPIYDLLQSLRDLLQHPDNIHIINQNPHKPNMTHQLLN